jgi:hypothetical protein
MLPRSLRRALVGESRVFLMRAGKPVGEPAEVFLCQIDRYPPDLER